MKQILILLFSHQGVSFMLMLKQSNHVIFLNVKLCLKNRKNVRKSWKIMYLCTILTSEIMIFKNKVLCLWSCLHHFEWSTENVATPGDPTPPKKKQTSPRDEAVATAALAFQNIFPSAAAEPFHPQLFLRCSWSWSQHRSSVCVCVYVCRLACSIKRSSEQHIEHKSVFWVHQTHSLSLSPFHTHTHTIARTGIARA